MGRISGTQVVAVVRHVLAEIVGEVVPAVVTVAAGHVCTNHHAVAYAQPNTFEIGVAAVASDGGDGPHVFGALNNRKANLLAVSDARILIDEALVGVLVGTADSRQLHFHQDTARPRLR